MQLPHAPCPKCAGTQSEKVSFTWWGGLPRPTLFSHVECTACKTEYNGKTGASNTRGIILYTVVGLNIAVILGILSAISGGR